MPGKERLLQHRAEHRVALGAEIGHPPEVVSADQDAEGHRQQQVHRKGPPDAGDDPQDDPRHLQQRHGDARQQHGGMHPFQLCASLHQIRYVADGFHREVRLLLHLAAQRLQLLQPGLAAGQLLPHRLLLLLQQQLHHPPRLLLRQKLGNGVDGQAHVPQEADDPQPPQVVVRIQPPPALGQLCGDQDAPAVVVLHRPHGDAAQLGQLTCGIFGHSVSPPYGAMIAHDAAS